MVIIDTNAIIRYILQDNQDMADLVEKQLMEVLCLIPTEVVAEVVYVLNKVYSIDRQVVAATLKDFFCMKNISIINRNVVNFALDVYSCSKLDFVDCLLVGYAKIEKYEVFTFDNI